ncbi:xylulose kinase [Didymella exigua CBS 183.55]|uniref:Xylulose kinase n=1 Tax=Didymella exigua CBS 183.55 TaxID=1150837 RepID=A0A6A5SA85_9PLEO|nr:xylulose kinase [Didymella exigua CBS 183.55]KAF1934387.1 xylulose kinase [Didymella exigua CBS 183.55]
MADQFLGFDLSTQQLKGIIVGSDLKLLHEAKVDFDADFGAKYGIEKGVLTNPAEGEVFAPVALFLEAIDLVLQRLREQGAEFAKVQGVSGAGMQHGTVFWSQDAEDLLRSLSPEKTLLEQLEGGAKGERKGAFSHPFSPNWQDASTQKQVEAFDAALGSPDELAEATGSKAHHRFSGPQILRFHTKYPDAYKATARITLVSSFLASIFLGRIAPMDISDVTGANLWDIKNGQWHEALLALAGGSPDTTALRAKLGAVPEDGGATLGPIAPYFAAKYGFPRTARILAFTGDNPSTILALPLRSSDAIVSLGTSTTFLMSTAAYKPDPAYHMMNHPTTPGQYMFMLCYKNGGLAREHIRDAINAGAGAGGQGPGGWDAFNAAALSTPVLGQHHPDSDPARLGLFFPRPEIVPAVRAGVWRYTASNDDSRLANAENTPAWPVPTADARAILESQLLSLRLRSQPLLTPQGSLPAQPRRVYLVGGGAANPAIATLAGQVLGGSEGVYKLEIGANACALGSAYKAAWGVGRKAGEAFEDFLEGRWDEESFVRRVAEGYAEGVFERYGGVLGAFAELEAVAVREKGEGRADLVKERGVDGGVVRGN